MSLFYKVFWLVYLKSYGDQIRGATSLILNKKTLVIFSFVFLKLKTSKQHCNCQKLFTVVKHSELKMKLGMFKCHWFFG